MAKMTDDVTQIVAEVRAAITGIAWEKVEQLPSDFPKEASSIRGARPGWTFLIVRWPALNEKLGFGFDGTAVRMRKGAPLIIRLPYDIARAGWAIWERQNAGSAK